MTPLPRRRSLLLAALGFALLEDRSVPLSVLQACTAKATFDCVDDALHRIGAMVQAARRWRRLMLDILEDRALFFSRDAVFLRFGRRFTGAVGTECNATAGEDSADVGGAGAGDVIELGASPPPFIPSGECGARFEDSSGFTGAEGAIIRCASLRSSIGPRPNANLTMAPYHLNMDSAVSSHSAAGVAIGVRSAVAASRGAVPWATSSRSNSRCCDLMTVSSGA